MALYCICLPIITIYCLPPLTLLAQLWPIALTCSLGGKACQLGQATSLTRFPPTHIKVVDQVVVLQYGKILFQL
jgi:hypothetical protein